MIGPLKVVPDHVDTGVSRPSILIVDDSPTMRHILRAPLEGAGYEVCEAGSGGAALELIKERAFDMLTLDVDLPGMSGYETCAEVRRLEEALSRRMVPVVFVTSQNSLSDRQRGFEVGATDFLSKPVDESELLLRVDRLLRAQQKLTGLRVLVVEDSKATRNIIAHTLSNSGMEVAEAEDGQVAFDRLQAEAGKFDLIIVDYDMPVMNGKELCRLIRTVLGMPWIPVIFLSGMAEMGYVLEMFEAGATDCITKPFTREELLARISVHAQLQRLKAEHERQIKELERLNTLKDGVLAIASHDLRAPLTGILGYSSLMLLDEQLPVEHRASIEGIQNSGKCLLGIVSDLLDLARLQAHQEEAVLTRCDLNEVVMAALSVLRHQAAPKGVCVLPSEGTQLPEVFVRGHRNSLMRIINNLVSNAVKFTERGGRVRVLAQPRGDGTVELSVEDTGVGIPAVKAADLFGKFGSSTEGTVGEPGTGLGMSIVKGLADLHQAQVHCESEAGVGTRVVVRFPKS